MFGYTISDEDFQSVMSRALTFVYSIQVKNGSSLDVIRRELIRIDVKNERRQNRRQVHSVQLNEYKYTFKNNHGKFYKHKPSDGYRNRS